MTYRQKIFAFIILSFITSYVLIPYDLFWGVVDKYAFYGFNSVLKLGKPTAFIVAAANHRLHDWFVDLVYLSLFSYYIFKKDHKSRAQKGFECLLVGLVMFCVIFMINRTFFRYGYKIASLSPSLKFKEYIRLNKLVPFLKTKCYSRSSFPADHASTALLFFFLTQPLFSKRQKQFLFVYTLLICLPRLIMGAHNLSDILIGSVTIASVSAFCFNYKGLLQRTAYFLSLKFSSVPIQK